MRKYKTNLKKSPINKDELKFGALLRGELEIKNEVNFISELPPIWDQGQLGSCQSHAINAIDVFLKKYSFTPAHLFEYYNVRKLEGTINEDSGGNLSDTCAALAQNGVSDSKYCPYDISKFTEEPSPEAYQNALSNGSQISNYYRAETIDEIKQSLSIGLPVLIGIEIYENFQTPECIYTGKIPAPEGSIEGGHALVIVGGNNMNPPKETCFIKKIIHKLKNKNQEATFLIRNSWNTHDENGRIIGLKEYPGYFEVTESVLKQLLMDSYVITK